MDDMSTSGPSDAAVEAAIKMLKAGEAQGHSAKARAHDIAYSALVEDEPRIRAEARAEMRDDIVKHILTLNDMYRWNDWICEQIKAKFSDPDKEDA